MMKKFYHDYGELSVPLFSGKKKKNHIEATKFLPKFDESGLSQLLWTDKMILRRCEVF